MFVKVLQESGETAPIDYCHLEHMYSTYIQIHCTTIIIKADKENIPHYLCLVLTHSELVLMAVHTLEWKWYL